MPFVPLIKTPFTDVTGVIGTHQNFGRCRDIEMRMINCFEAYGLGRGVQKCSEVVDDFKECFGREKQDARVAEMTKERERQKAAGTENYLPEPRLDAFREY